MATIRLAASKLKSSFALLREWWRPLLTALGMCLLILLTRPSSNVDRKVSDQLLVSQRAAADRKILLIEINGEDVRRYGGPPIGRDGLGKLMNSVADGQPKRVLLDIFLGERMDDTIDGRLTAALARLGPQKLGMVTSPTPMDRPYARFGRHATLVDARLTQDTDGWHRRIGLPGQFWGINAAAWLATGKADRDDIPLDIRIASREYERRSVHDVISGKVDLKNRLVLISASARIAPSRAFLPYTSTADRGAVMAMGAQSVQQGYREHRKTGLFYDSLLQISAILLGFFCAMSAKSGWQLVLRGLSAAIVLFTLSITIGLRWGVEFAPVSLVTSFGVMINVTLAQRLKLVSMMRSFMKGDLSPEEVWAWRSCESASHSVLLFSAEGRVKRANIEATKLFGSDNSHLVAACMPKIGERNDEVSMVFPDGRSRIYQLDWPFEHVPIVVMRDVTEAEESQRLLREQLMTDEMTGSINRRGFDHALNTLSKETDEYAVFFIDMNGFKSVNDTYGHDAGDELLIVAAKRLAGAVRPGDTVARLGGDEFAVLAPRKFDDNSAAQMAARLSEVLRNPVRLTNVPIPLRVGGGVGYAMPRIAGEEPADVLRRADQVMYRNKLEMKARRAA